MSDEEEKKCECPAGLPGWLATFADLMSLLMCFFVLLLSFAEMDVLKFKRLAGSMRSAFGVQNQVNVNDIPKGTSIVAQEFSPGKPEPTPLKVVMQQTADPDKQSLELLCEAEIEKALEQECDQVDAEQKKQNEVVVQKLQKMLQETEDNAMDLAAKLEAEIRNDQVEIETRGRKIVIRVKEKGSFASGSAELQDEFFPILEKLIASFKKIEGSISVEGHTDSVPIQTAEFPSNWDLSTARALEVARGLFEDGSLDQSRFRILGLADTRPLVPNNTADNRAINRRVEIILQQPTGDERKEELEKMREYNPDAFLESDPKVDEIFDLDSNEIF
ncbi:MAG: type VI secretion system protein TssL [Gammaproteobacteria bacterium]|nr:MAG: type VI secretion system protein TssL [Gammaproteobacteria bacterium]